MNSAGLLRQRVTLQRAVDVQDATTGAVAYDWQDIAEVWAHVQPISGKEFVRGNLVVGEMDTLIYIRWAPALRNLGTKNRVLHMGTYYNILSVTDVDFAHVEIELLCKSGVNDG